MSEKNAPPDAAARQWYDLLVAARAGGPLDGLLSQLWAFWFFIALRVLGNHEDAADAAQDASVRLIRGLDRFDPERPHQVRAWLARLGRNCAIDLVRRRRKTVGLEHAGDVRSGDDPADLAERRDEAERIRRELQALAPELAEAVRLHLMEGLTLNETGERTGLSVTGVFHRVRRGVEALGRGLNPDA